MSVFSFTTINVSEANEVQSHQLGLSGILLEKAVSVDSDLPLGFHLRARARRIVLWPAPVDQSLRGSSMGTKVKLSYLQIALIVFGLAMIFGFYPLTVLWSSGWEWGHGSSHYIYMIIGIYATLGIFLVRAARCPTDHQSLIWFTVWSSVVHAGVMLVQAIHDPMERGHLIGDIPALCLVALVLAGLMRQARLSGEL
jgi:hypothetical protein